jgi:ligand-binding sensor domain-containing protein
MWFGTSDGLNRFDGKNFKIFRHIPKDSTSLGNNIVRTIFEDERQNLWVGTNRGIYIFNSQQE